MKVGKAVEGTWIVWHLTRIYLAWRHCSSENIT